MMMVNANSEEYSLHWQYPVVQYYCIVDIVIWYNKDNEGIIIGKWCVNKLRIMGKTFIKFSIE